ncbi:MAG: nucleotidyl transferase AbiEii/AbiGii toxin family protein [Polyangiaceae bacterium]
MLDFHVMFGRRGPSIDSFSKERFLYRLSTTPHRARLVLKSALTLHVWEAPLARATKDLDFLGRLDNSLENLERVIREVCAADVEPRRSRKGGSAPRPDPQRTERRGARAHRPRRREHEPERQGERAHRAEAQLTCGPTRGTPDEAARLRMSGGGNGLAATSAARVEVVQWTVRIEGLGPPPHGSTFTSRP